MKALIVVIISAAVVVSAWFGVNTWQRGRILNSGRVVLLVHEKNRVYTYSDLMPRKEISRAYKIIGYANELTPEEIASATKGLNFKVDAEITPGDPRIIPFARVPAPVPVTAAQQQAWTASLAALSAGQRSLCEKIEATTLQQYCLTRHIVFNAITSNAPAVACDVLFLPAQREECLADLKAKDMKRLADDDKDSLLDLFEEYVTPDDQRINKYNLPEITI